HDKVHTIHLGVEVDDYHYLSAREKPRNVGFISRLCYENGFDIVVDAFILLKNKPGFEDVGLIATGGSTSDDNKFIKEQKRKLKDKGLADAYKITPDFKDTAIHDFFSQVSLVSVPVRAGEAFGIYLLESMASGVPVVQPALGAFPEIIELSGGGITYMPDSPEKLSEAWAELLSDPDRLEQLSVAGHQGVKEKFNINSHARELV